MNPSIDDVHRMYAIEKQRSFLLFGISLQLVIALAVGSILPGVSFYIFVPALLGTLALAAAIHDSDVVKHITYCAKTLTSPPN